jgi:hypothetical protein
MKGLAGVAPEAAHRESVGVSHAVRSRGDALEAVDDLGGDLRGREPGHDRERRPGEVFVAGRHDGWICTPTLRASSSSSGIAASKS